MAKDVKPKTDAQAAYEKAHLVAQALKLSLRTNRPTWHYELGATLVIGDKAKLNVPNAPGSLPIDANIDTQTCTLRRQSSFAARFLVTQCQPQRIAPLRVGLGILSPMFTSHAMKEAFTWKMSSPKRMVTEVRTESLLSRIETCMHFGTVCLVGISILVIRQKVIRRAMTQRILITPPASNQ